MNTLYELVGSFRALERLDPSDDLPAEAIADTLEALEGDITVKSTNVAKFVLNIEAMADAVEGAAKAMKLRAERMRDRAANIRKYLQVNMSAAGITKIEATEFVLSIRKNPPSVVIDDEALLPIEFMTQPPRPPQPPARPDKTVIVKALKVGLNIPGAHLEQGERLVITQ